MWREGSNGISTSLLNDRLLVTLQGDLDRPLFERLMADVMGLVQAHGLKVVMVDVSSVLVIDAQEFAELRRVLDMVQLLGALPVLIGLQPGAVAFLVGAGVDTDGLVTARGLHDVDRVLALREAP